MISRCNFALLIACTLMTPIDLLVGGTRIYLPLILK